MIPVSTILINRTPPNPKRSPLRQAPVSCGEWWGTKIARILGRCALFQRRKTNQQFKEALNRHAEATGQVGFGPSLRLTLQADAIRSTLHHPHKRVSPDFIKQTMGLSRRD